MTLRRLAALISAVPLAFTVVHLAHAGHSHMGGGGHVGGIHGTNGQFAHGQFGHGRFHGGGAPAHHDGFVRPGGFRQDGRFMHGFHGGHVGWWWVTGGIWYPWYADTVPYTGPESAYAAPTAWYFFCPSAGTYYPYVTYCPVAWQPIPATSASY